MTTSQAIIVGAIIIGASIIGTRIIAPYEFTSGPAYIYRLNTMSGNVRECVRGVDAREPRIVTNCEGKISN